jgi:hypothetical protein
MAQLHLMIFEHIVIMAMISRLERCNSMQDPAQIIALGRCW